MIKKSLLIFLVIFSYKLIINIVNLIKVTYYCNLYNDFIDKKSNKILLHKNHVLELFLRANISDCSLPITQPTGFNYVSTGTASIFKNFPTDNPRLIIHTKDAFENAIGIYRGRIIECFSPIFWIESIIFLPKKILNYINIPVESIIVKIFQLLYWLIGIIVTLFSSDIANFIKSFYLR